MIAFTFDGRERKDDVNSAACVLLRTRQIHGTCLIVKERLPEAKSGLAFGTVSKREIGRLLGNLMDPDEEMKRRLSVMERKSMQAQKRVISRSFNQMF